MLLVLSSLLLVLASCTPRENTHNYLEVDLQSTSPRSSQYFDFGTGDYDLKVDNKGILLRQPDGSMAPLLPVMGEIHPSRVRESDWSRELDKMKEGGITVVACYLFWSHHEAKEGQFDWTGNRNIRRFVQLCGEKDLLVVLRIGPFCHGECYLGGIPDWLVAEDNVTLRSLDPRFMQAVGNLYQQIGEQTKGLYGCTNQQPIIGVQIENECGGEVWPYMKALKELAVSKGIRPPFFTRTGWPAMKDAEFGEMLPLYGDYADGFWDREFTDMPGGYPDAFCFRSSRLSNVIATEVFGTNQSRKMEQSDLSYPYFTCELGGGMMTSYARRIHIFDHDAIALAICKIGSGSNLPGYYMYHGGTNPTHPKHSMGELTNSPFTNWNDLPYMSYDFQCPVGEMGQINPSYYELRRLHHFLAHWGAELSDYDVVFPATNSEDGRQDSLLRYTVRTDGMRGFVFVNNYQRMQTLSDKKQIQFKLNRTDGSSLIFPSQPVDILDGTVCWLPFGLNLSGHVLDFATVMPYDQLQDKGSTIYLFATVPGIQPELSIDGKLYSPTPGTDIEQKDTDDNTIIFRVIDDAETLRPIDAYTLSEIPGAEAKANLVADTKGLRTLSFVWQGIAGQPENKDFDQAATWNISLNGISNAETAVLEVNYKGDVARLYANGQLIEDNFWNGRPMLVRLQDIAGKKIQLKILPLGKEYPVYLQPDQRKALAEAEGDYLLSLDSLRILDFATENK